MFIFYFLFFIFSSNYVFAIERIQDPKSYPKFKRLRRKKAKKTPVQKKSYTKTDAKFQRTSRNNARRRANKLLRDKLREKRKKKRLSFNIKLKSKARGFKNRKTAYTNSNLIEA